MSSKQSLLNTLKDIRRISYSGTDPGSPYYCPCGLKDILHLSVVQEILKTVPHIREDERILFASLICDKASKIFCILCLNNHEKYITEFLFRRIDDSAIPLSPNDLEFMSCENEEAQEDFLRKQWRFNPICLHRGDIHRELLPKEILPFQTDKYVARGAFGEVYQVKIDPQCHNLLDTTPDIQFVARKEMKAAKNRAEEKDVLEERAFLEMIRKIQHPNIIELLTSYKYRETYNFLFPYASSDLKTFLNSDHDMTNDEIYYNMYGVADALVHIHEFTFHDDNINLMRIGYHHDLRPANILCLGRRFVITDFGLSKFTSASQTSKDLLRGGVDEYLSPEAINDVDWTKGEVGRALDIWSLSCIFAELVTVTEGFKVREFQESRRRERRQGSLKSIDYTFHSSGELKDGVRNWLNNLKGSGVPSRTPKNPQTPALVALIEDMLNPKWRIRIKIREVTRRLSEISFKTKASAIESLLRPFERVRDLDQASHIFMFLEGTRFAAVHEVFEHLNREFPASFHKKIDQTLASMVKLQDALAGVQVSPRILHNSIESAFASTEVQEVCKIIDDIVEQLPDHSRQQIEQNWSRNVANIDEVDVLRTIKAAAVPDRYHAVGIKATMKLMSSAVSIAMKEPREMMLSDAGMVDLDDPVSRSQGLAQQALDALRSIGYYFETREPRTVLIEWRKYDIRWNSAPNDKQFSQLNSMAKFLSATKNPRDDILFPKLVVLDCLAFFHDKDRNRFGFIYGFPQESVDNHAPSFPQYYSLHQYIRDTSLSRFPDQQNCAPRPYLGKVFQLAKDLASSLYDLHEIGWLHKSISSHNILMFPAALTEASNYLSSSVLSGFVQSRPEQTQNSVGGPAPTYDLYEHPSYRKLALTKSNDVAIVFRRVYDFYSLGVVLLELGLWMTSSELYQPFRAYWVKERSKSKDEEIQAEKEDLKEISIAESFRDKLLERYVPRLGGKMGELYMDAVRFCLDAEKSIGFTEDDAEGRQRCGKEFKIKVVDKLAGCSA